MTRSATTPDRLRQTLSWLTFSQLISLIWGENWHIFIPDRGDPGFDDKEYDSYVFIKQVLYFGPIPLSYEELLADDDEKWAFLGGVTQYIGENKKWKPFSQAVDKELTVEDRAFLIKIMKLDPRDRPTAKELLLDSWFDES